MTHVMAYAGLALFVASFACYTRILYVPSAWVGRLATLLLASGILFEYFALLDRSHLIHSVPYDDLYGSMLLFAWLLAITYLGLEIFHRQRAVGALVTLLLVIWIAGLAMLVPMDPMDPSVTSPPAHGALFALHVTLNTWAYAAFGLSFVLSLVFLVQDRLLHSRRLGATFWRFPALDALDRMARSSVWVGLWTLCVGAILGLIWSRRLNGTYDLGDPKVIVTLAIIGAYIAYLGLSRTARWRGARAALLCAFNFMVVMFSYTFVNLYLTRFHRFF